MLGHCKMAVRFIVGALVYQQFFFSMLVMQAAFENFVGHPVASAVSSRTVSCNLCH